MLNLTSIYKVSYFEGDVLDEKQGDLAKHEHVPFQPNFQNQYATSSTDHFTNTPINTIDIRLLLDKP